MLLDNDHSAFQWELSPTRSMSWRCAKVMMLGVTSVSLTIGAMAFLLGFPYVLPFCGLEAVVFCISFYLVQIGGEIRETIKIEDGLLVFERDGSRDPRRLVANKHWVRVFLNKPRSKLEKLRLYLRYAGEEIELGGFLSDAEKRKFAKVLINAMN